MADKQFIVGVARTRQIDAKLNTQRQQIHASVAMMLAQTNEVYKGDVVTVEELNNVPASVGDYADVFETNTRWAKTSTGWKNTERTILINPLVATKQDINELSIRVASLESAIENPTLIITKI